jgi:hypothetical protein
VERITPDTSLAAYTTPGWFGSKWTLRKFPAPPKPAGCHARLEGEGEGVGAFN